MEEWKKKHQRPACGPVDTGGGEACTPRCPLSIKRWGALKGKVGGVVQGQRQFYLTPTDSTAIGVKHLANFNHWDTGWYMEFIWEQNLGWLRDSTLPTFPSIPPHKYWPINVTRPNHSPNSWLEIVNVETEYISLLSRSINVLIESRRAEVF